VQQVAVQQTLGETVAIVRGAHQVEELLEPFAIGRPDLRVHRVEKCQAGQQILPWRSHPAGVLTTRPTRPADRLVERQRMQPSEQIGHDREILGAAGKRGAVDELGDEHRAPVEVGHRVVDREPFRGVVVPLEKAQYRGVALDIGPRPGRRERPSDPRGAVVPVDAEDVRLVHAQLGRRDRVDTVAIPKVDEQPIGVRLVVDAVAQTFEIGQRFGVPLARLLGVPPYDLLEIAVLRHDKPPRRHPRPPVTRCSEMACWHRRPRGLIPLRPMEPRLGRMSHGSATGRRRQPISPTGATLVKDQALVARVVDAESNWWPNAVRW
jgi:hypothetical protein